MRARGTNYTDLGRCETKQNHEDNQDMIKFVDTIR